MLPRVRSIPLRNGTVISTPMLVPSFSSRATGPIRYQQSPCATPEPTPCSLIHSDSLIYGIEESLLISAYDIHHGLLVDSSSFQCGFNRSRYALPKVLFIDSGWYEKTGNSPDKQFGENRHLPMRWEQSDYRDVVDSLDKDLTAILVSWDHFGSYGEQIAAGQSFLSNRDNHASALLLKPPRNSSIHDLDKLSGEDFSNLRAFDIIGVTEREIGESVIERLVNIAKLRRGLDSADVVAPIHVFGGLDPLYTPLYFAAGGELFDGLGWLRYTYREGVAMHRDTAAILDRQIDRRRIPNSLRSCLRNLDELRRLSDDLRRFAHQNSDWKQLARGEVLEPIFESLQERLGV